MSLIGTKQVSSRTEALPQLLRFTDVRLYVFTAVFIALDVGVPWALHRIHPSAGPIFLPLFFFSLLAGLLFGWRVGLLVGLISPLVSYAISGAPALWRLAEITIENSVFGFSAGLLLPRFKSNVIWSLLATLIAGYSALTLAVLAFHPERGNPLVWVWPVIQQGWPGIVVQLVCLPLIVTRLNAWLAKRDYLKAR